jgi:tight adherence protein C
VFGANDILLIMGALILGAAVFYIVFTTQRAAETSKAEDLLGVKWGDDKDPFKPPFYLSLTKPLLKGAYLDIAKGFWSVANLEKWRTTLISAGWGRFVSPEMVVGSKFWMTLMMVFIVFLNRIFQEKPMPGWMAIGLPVIMFFYPNIHISSLRSMRQLEIRLAMPYVVDLLCLSIEAGLDFIGAIGRVVDRSPPGPLAEELATTLKDIQLGKTRGQALRAMADRTDMPEISSFVAILISADQMGASIGNVLRAQSDTMRNERLAKAEKMGAAASQKILVPLVMFILPAVLLIIFGPIILQMMGVKA